VLFFWNDILSTLGEGLFFVLGSNLVLLGTFWLGVLIYLAFDRFKLFQKYHIQKDKYPSSDQIEKALKLVLFNQLAVQFPFSILAYLMLKGLGLQFQAEAIPAWYILVIQIIVFILIEDTLFYWSHRLLHLRGLYRSIHKIHHQFHVPTALASIYAHPVEFFISNIFPTMGGPFLLILMGVPVHLFTLWVWLFLRIVETMNEHSGYEFTLWPFYRFINREGSRIHDYHHSHNKGNFAAFFFHWDRLCGTNVGYKEYQSANSSPSKTRSLRLP
jgi:sterol desaturase/sphingolipid hydroxylase (fatty acid hydroxylase superfamily)